MRFDILSKLLLYSSLGAHFVCCSWILDRLIAGNLLSALPLWYLFLPWIVRSVIGSYAFLGLTGLGVSAPLILFAGLRWVVEKFVGRKIRHTVPLYLRPLCGFVRLFALLPGAGSVVFMLLGDFLLSLCFLILRKPLFSRRSLVAA